MCDVELQNCFKRCAGRGPHLEFSIRVEVVKAWEIHAVSAEVFQDVSLSSNTEWDIRIRKLLSNPKRLVINFGACCWTIDYARFGLLFVNA